MLAVLSWLTATWKTNRKVWHRDKQVNTMVVDGLVTQGAKCISNNDTDRLLLVPCHAEDIRVSLELYLYEIIEQKFTLFASLTIWNYEVFCVEVYVIQSISCPAQGTDAIPISVN